jgi:hypothetical protein
MTIATTKAVYWDMAVNLARSFRWWHRSSDVAFQIVTDLDLPLPDDLREVIVNRVPAGQLGIGFAPKLHLDRLAPAPRTLFIDADCLCVGSLEPVFDQLRGRPVAVLGGAVAQGEWFGDVGAICAKFGVPALPKFNGGIYYIERGERAQRVYDQARELEREYDELGLVRLRGRPNEEILIAIAMACQGLEAVPDGGAVMGDPQACPARLEVDVLKGRSLLENPPPPDPRHRDWYPFHRVQPLVVHFLGDYTSSWQYRAETMKLTLAMGWRVPAPAAQGLVWLAYALPARAWEASVDLLRPLFRRLFGTRRIRPSPRV